MIAVNRSAIARPPVGAPARRPLELVLFGGLLLGAQALRTYRLGVPVLTGDEWFMLRNAHEGPAWIVHQAHIFEPHPLLYYLGFWAWVGLAGATEWAMRYPSALFGVLTCAAIWRLTRDAAGPGVALAATFLAAINPYQVAQSQNARNYAMVTALSALATAVLLVAARRGGRAWYGYAAALLLALHTHLNAVLAAAAHALWVVARALWRRERPDPAALRAGALVAILFLPWLVYAAPALTAYQGYFPERVGFVEVLTRTLGTFEFGQSETPRRALVAVCAGLIGLATVWALWRAARARDESGLLLVLVAGLPIVSAAAAFLVRPMFEERYLIVAAPATIALVAIGAALLGRPHPGVGLAAIGWLTFVSSPFLERYYPAVENARPDWRGLASWIATSARPGEVVLITGHGVADLFGYYGRGGTPTVLAADTETAPRDMDALLASGPRGAFHLPYLDAPPDQLAHDRLTAIGFPAETRWFRSQRAQYFALPRPDFPEPHPIGARWLGSIELASGAAGPRRVAPGEAIEVQLAWQVLDAAPDLKLSLRLVASDGQSVAQLDRRPVDETRPFPTMRPGESLRDGHALRVPDSAVAGRYDVALLLYQPADARAVAPTVDGALQVSTNHDLVRVGSIEVVAAPPR